MSKIKSFFKSLAKDESAQGATEYILILVVVVGLALAFRRKLTEIIGSKLDQLGSDVGGFTSQ